MADFSNYGEFREFLRSMSHRGSSLEDATINGFIQQAESMVERRVRAIEMIRSNTLGESDRGGSTPIYTLPPNFMGMRNIRQDGQRFSIELVSQDQLQTYSLNGDVCFASIYGFRLEFRGNPAMGSEFNITFFARPMTLENDSDTHELLTNQPDMYANAALSWLYLHVRQLQLARAHANAFNLIVDEVNLLASQQRGSAGTAPSNNLGHRARSSM